MRKSTKLIAAGAAMFFGAVWVTPWASHIPPSLRFAVGVTWVMFVVGCVVLVVVAWFMRDEGR